LPKQGGVAGKLPIDLAAKHFHVNESTAPDGFSHAD
jgi:hypothetical protein